MHNAQTKANTLNDSFCSLFYSSTKAHTLDVTVHNIILVQVMQAVQDLPAVLPCHVLRERTVLLHKRGHAATGDKLEVDV